MGSYFYEASFDVYGLIVSHGQTSFLTGHYRLEMISTHVKTMRDQLTNILLKVFNVKNINYQVLLAKYKNKLESCEHLGSKLSAFTVVHITKVLIMSYAFDPSYDRLHGALHLKEPNRHGVIGIFVVGFAKHASCCGLILWIRDIPQNP